jgi:hypothetical protein
MIFFVEDSSVTPGIGIRSKDSVLHYIPPPHSYRLGFLKGAPHFFSEKTTCLVKSNSPPS